MSANLPSENSINLPDAQAALVMGQSSKCANCRKREGTLVWGDALAMTHGFAVKWCEICALEAQIKHAKERARKLPGMERKLARLKARETRKAAR